MSKSFSKNKYSWDANVCPSPTQIRLHKCNTPECFIYYITVFFIYRMSLRIAVTAFITSKWFPDIFYPEIFNYD